MAGELIRLDHKHIFIKQMKMCYIHNMSGPPSPLIEKYLR
ncbi:hypothetical protein Goshw_007833 [Gossypium schwendimanii]|uniref:Uncharacterized protein n=1 Tax=Gossypium schwendimanii TaxID=34291 RepID=A0A7J9LEZ6_GOSSC|nr:hypothetical protein [Gossypium schwendimanii]